MLTKQQLELLLAMMEQSSFPGKILRLALETQAELQRQLEEPAFPLPVAE